MELWTWTVDRLPSVFIVFFLYVFSRAQALDDPDSDIPDP
jgi:hypothetical protein